MDTGISMTSKERAYVSTDDFTLIRKMNRLSEEHPGEVVIIAEPEENDGCWYGTVPGNWIKIAPPIKRNLTDEQRAEMAERLKLARSLKEVK